MFIVYLHKQVFLYRANLVLSERSCQPDGEVLWSTPKGVLMAQDLRLYNNSPILLRCHLQGNLIRESVDSLCRDGAGPPIVCVH